MHREMTSFVAVGEVEGRAARAWHTEPDGTLEIAFEEGKLFRIRCRCDRCHWIVRTRTSGGTVKLDIRCHSCGTAASFPLRPEPEPH